MFFALVTRGFDLQFVFLSWLEMGLTCSLFTWFGFVFSNCPGCSVLVLFLLLTVLCYAMLWFYRPDIPALLDWA